MIKAGAFFAEVKVPKQTIFIHNYDCLLSSVGLIPTLIFIHSYDCLLSSVGLIPTL
jgi:hypothetical protein